MPAPRKIPMRQCIACREQKPKRELLRVVKTAAGEISLDLTGKLAGRGAYVCDSEACIRRLRKAHLLNRAFSSEVSEEVYARIEEQYAAK